uniref:Uncharacterized protein n=1 Tax=Anguilla anguilla TaxID=7936 RepID=A0A0E9SX15_ANGAN
MLTQIPYLFSSIIRVKLYRSTRPCLHTTKMDAVYWLVWNESHLPCVMLTTTAQYACNDLSLHSNSTPFSTSK